MTGAVGDRYAPLRQYLAELAAGGEQAVTLDFAEIDVLVGGLPPTAHTKKAWWANGRSAQARAWLDAGWRVEVVGFFQRRVVFARLEAPSADERDATTH